MVRSVGVLTAVAVALLLAGCSSVGSGSDPDRSEHPSPSDRPSAKPVEPQDRHPDDQKPLVRNPFETSGFTIRYLQDGKIKKIDVPDFKH